MNIYKKSNFFTLLIYVLLQLPLPVQSQDSTQKANSINWQMYLEIYYSYSPNKPPTHEKADFIFNHARTNEVTINLGLIKFTYQKQYQRANFALMTGTYPQYNLSSEPELLRLVYEANIGLKISKEKDLWIDAGIMPSHIGLETAISKDCWTLTRSIAAENSPYYEAGTRISYKTKNYKWLLAGLLLNGWQKIIRPEGNNSLALGTQVSFNPNDKATLNFSTFLGNDKTDSAGRTRYFSNLAGTIQFSKYLSGALNFDLGFEQQYKNSNKYSAWYAPFLILRYKKNVWAVALRAEYYSDIDNVIIKRQNSKPFQLQGYSLNADRMIGKNFLCRIETKWLKTKYPYFKSSSGSTTNELSVTTSIAFSLDRQSRE